MELWATRSSYQVIFHIQSEKGQFAKNYSGKCSKVVSTFRGSVQDGKRISKNFGLFKQFRFFCWIFIKKSMVCKISQYHWFLMKIQQKKSKNRKFLKIPKLFDILLSSWTHSLNVETTFEQVLAPKQANGPFSDWMWKSYLIWRRVAQSST